MKPLLILVALALGGCASDGSFDSKGFALGVGVVSDAYARTQDHAAAPQQWTPQHGYNYGTGPLPQSR